MKGRTPYQIIKRRRITEKASRLQGLATSTSNKCVARCKNLKYVFDVDVSANKQQIKEAIEVIYAEKKISVVAVNTIREKPRAYQKKKGRNAGKGVMRKKAIITLAVGDTLEG